MLDRKHSKYKMIYGNDISLIIFHLFETEEEIFVTMYYLICCALEYTVKIYA